MRRIHGLSTSEQLKVFLQLRAYLGDAVGEETEADKEIRERGEALDAMRKVAEHLGGFGESRSRTNCLQVGHFCGHIGVLHDGLPQPCSASEHGRNLSRGGAR